MKRFTKRGLSLLLVLAMCISLLTGLSFVSNAATVEYVYGSYEDFTNVIYNWGVRGNTATFLSPNAEEYYEEKGTSYEELAALAGNANTASAPNSALYIQLKELMTDGMTNTSYGDARYLFPFTDCQNSNTSYISSFYDGAEYSNVWDAGKTYNREHVWPKSKLQNTSPSASTKADSSDLMMLRPVTANLNSSRGDKAYGESGKYFAPNSNVGTTGYDVRGDVARTLLYGYVRWDNTAKMWGETGVIESLDILLAWMIADPVDTWEMGRNDSVESINGTRNVFVDYPELAFELFEREIPEAMATPSTGTSYNVTAVSSNNAWGSAKVAGNVVNVYPETGYEFAGYRVTSGTAEVTVQGNVLFVAASSDCTITVDFKTRSTRTLLLMSNGQQISTLTAYAGDSVALPDDTLAVLDGYTFMGWVTEEITEEITDMPTLYPAGAEYVVNENTCLYALFTRLGEGTNSSGTFELFSGTLTEGDYMIVAGNGTQAMKASVTKNRFDYMNVTAVGSAIQSTDKNIIWHIAPTGDGYYTFYNEATGKYAGASGTKSQGKLLDSVTDFAKWSVTTTPVITNLGNGNKGVNNTLRCNDTYGFAAYAATTGTAPIFYKAQSGVAYYTTGDTAQLPPAEDNTIQYWCNDELVDTFATVEEALAVAAEGTVLLTKDVTAGNVIVKPGVTLDLNGNALAADLLIAMDGAIVCDGGAACVGGGLVKIAQGNLVLAKENGDGIIPVWNGVDGYIFTRVTFQQTTAAAAAGSAKYIFLPSFSNADAAALLADGGMDNELTIKVCLTWNDGYSQQFYTYSDDLVKLVYDGTGSLAFDLTVTGVSGITDLIASPVVVTNSGAQATTFGTALTA